VEQQRHAIAGFTPKGSMMSKRRDVYEEAPRARHKRRGTGRRQLVVGDEKGSELFIKQF
jgi:hypothetical protein